MSQIPENILRRSAEARAKKEGRSVDEILAEMKGETPPQDSSPADSSPSTPTPPPEPEESPSGGEGGRAPASPEPESKTAAAGGPDRAPTAPGSGADTGSGTVSSAALLTAVAGARKMPESLVLRSATARSRTAGGSVDDVLLEWAREEGIDVSSLPTAAETPAPAPSPQIPHPEAEVAPDRSAEEPRTDSGRGSEAPAAPSTASESVAPVAASAAAGVAVAVLEDEGVAEDEPSPNGAKSDRLLTVIRAGEVQRIRSEPTDRVTVWPHLLAIEFVALLVVLTLLIAMSVFLDAPLLEFANFNEQPNPSKAPWYFLGLQELLAYFDPQVAGIIIPTFGALAIAIIPYIDKNPSVKPSHRKLAIMIFTFFIMAAAVLTIFGSFFRGPGFNFTFPWEDGIFFDDLKSLLE